ncbi:hypothetical protein DKX38_007633 [Salix brachista]|uniref:F-box domain-containing protein n=1 Tax=Salix brachista TaxID=2182728 RepID=A0A5N5MNQ7_9ROSI|nr:hypothetical protein DKX38_007633 [Salix brachista]
MIWAEKGANQKIHKQRRGEVRHVPGEVVGGAGAEESFVVFRADEKRRQKAEGCGWVKASVVAVGAEKELWVQRRMWMEIDDTSNHSWADLPKELLEMIGKRLDSRIDVYRFRAVCTSWRSSISVFYKKSPRVPLKLPKPIRVHAYLSRVTICRVELADDSDDSSSSSSMAWLTKVEESSNGDIQLLVPVSNCQLSTDSPGMVPKMLNLLDFRLVEITKACSLKLDSGSSYGINKAVWLPSSANRNTNECCDALAIFLEGKLGYRKFDEKEWKFIGKRNSRYDDISVYRGQAYVVDRSGRVYWIDPPLKVIQYSPRLNGGGSQKSLVESDGDLYVVDRFFAGERRAKTIRIRVYKLDEEGGTWVNISSLGDKVFVLGNECSFSVSAKEFSGGEGNCIYFIDPFDAGLWGELSGCDARVCDLSSGRISKVADFPGHSCILWPPPAQKVRGQILP